MAIEQLSRADSAPDSGCLQNLNFLSICDSSQSSAKKAVELSQTSAQETAQLDCQLLDFSAPVFPGEELALLDVKERPAAPTQTKADVDAKPPNKYEQTVIGQLSLMNDEAKFSVYTKDALMRDADRFPPVRNDAENSTTYSMELFGFSDRESADPKLPAEPYKRMVTITVPDGATSLKDCKFEFQDRQKIEQRELNDLVTRAQIRQGEIAGAAPAESKLPRPNDVSFFTHGIRTAEVSTDLYSLSLQLTNGHSVINVDWKSVPPSEENGTDLEQAYNNERKRAAESYPRFEKLIDETIKHVGADQTTIIAFSHGAMFNTRYLQHRKESGADLLNHVIFSHPDVPCRTLPQPGADGSIAPENRLFACVSKQTHVIGSTADMAMTGAAKHDEPRVEGQWKITHYLKGTDDAYARIGNGARISRNLVEGSGGTYVIETQKGEKKDLMCHFINMESIGELMNGAPKLKVAVGSAAEK